MGWRFTQNPTGHDYGHHMSKVTWCILCYTMSCNLIKYNIIQYKTMQLDIKYIVFNIWHFFSSSLSNLLSAFVALLLIDLFYFSPKLLKYVHMDKLVSVPTCTCCVYYNNSQPLIWWVYCCRKKWKRKVRKWWWSVTKICPAVVLVIILFLIELWHNYISFTLICLLVLFILF